MMAGVEAARAEPLAGHPMAARITHDWRDAVAATVDDQSYKVEGSPGKGNWAESVWLSVFDRTITETAQRGFYVVYLVAPDGSRTFLSLNQGTTEILDRVGGRQYREVLADTAERDVGLLTQEDTTGLTTGAVDLDGTTTLTRGYEAGNILALEYRRGEVPAEEDVETDLTRFLVLYRALIEARDQVQADGGDAEDPSGVPRRGIEASATAGIAAPRGARAWHVRRSGFTGCGVRSRPAESDLATGTARRARDTSRPIT